MKAHCLIPVAALLFAGPAFAHPTAATDPPAAQPQDRSATTLPDQRSLDDYRCLRHTGSRITAARNQREELRRPTSSNKTSASKQRCAPVAGRAWDREDLERTGASNIADALRMLDPSVY